jgi:hypothetical protein
MSTLLRAIGDYLLMSFSAWFAAVQTPAHGRTGRSGSPTRSTSSGRSPIEVTPHTVQEPLRPCGRVAGVQAVFPGRVVDQLAYLGPDSLLPEIAGEPVSEIVEAYGGREMPARIRVVELTGSH